ncbi:hypothetical protein [Nitratireductor luteus]|uniref:hypothetical protein n=1 Tax=Nitratireductor luteus TaxID=2976980 RepID=UPI00223FB91A|nr:hypothetical protein [Nitratireductor luteus]
MEGVEQIEKDAGENASATEEEATARAKETIDAEETIDQVRALLFGGAQRSLENRLVGLREEMQASLKEFQAELAAVREMILELERSSEKKQLDSHKEIGAAISKLGTTISALGSDRAGK